MLNYFVENSISSIWQSTNLWTPLVSNKTAAYNRANVIVLHWNIAVNNLILITNRMVD